MTRNSPSWLRRRPTSGAGTPNQPNRSNSDAELPASHTWSAAVDTSIPALGTTGNQPNPAVSPPAVSVSLRGTYSSSGDSTLQVNRPELQGAALQTSNNGSVQPASMSKSSSAYDLQQGMLNSPSMCDLQSSSLSKKTVTESECENSINGDNSSSRSSKILARGSRSGWSKHSAMTLHYLASKKRLELGEQQQNGTETVIATDDISDADSDLEEPDPVVPPRAWNWTHAWVNGMTLLVILMVLGWSFYSLPSTIVRVKAYYAFFCVALIPMGIFFFSYALKCAISGMFSLLLGGTSCLERNAQHYSALKTPIPKGTTKLPQIVVQMPVYKESLDEVIRLSYFNVKKAMEFYESKGGTAKYIICDDGFQVISPEEAVARANFYTKHNIAFVARPPVGRRGLFKKASNMNYQLSVSDRVSKLMKEKPGMTSEEALAIVWDERDREFVAAGDLTMDEDCLILLIDADTKVPLECMYETIGESLEDKTVAYTQHYTTPFNEQCRNYWEQHVSAFTRTIYFQGIAVSVAFGDTSPLVGHNAFLRWAALRNIGYHDEFCRPNEVKYWSENSVSEDFDMYMRLANSNAFGRYVMYTGEDFQEGVSLTYMDEVIKFKKFAYGACEMLFHPFKLWPTHGPITRMFLLYLKNKHIGWNQKVSMLTYLSSYFAMSAAFYFCILEGVMSVIDPKFHDYFMTRSFDVMLTCTLIFTGIGSVCGGIFYHWRRTAAKQGGNVFRLIYQQLKWLPTTALFFNSVLFHTTVACFYYFFDLKVVWGATAKETKNKSCFEALRETLVGYWFEYVVYVIMLSGYSFCLWYFDIGMYRGWGVMSYSIGHILGPLLLNPHILSFSW